MKNVNVNIVNNQNQVDQDPGVLLTNCIFT